jgi:hypothetical protein
MSKQQISLDRRRLLQAAPAAAIASSFSLAPLARALAADAEDKLTEFGAEREGNADGSIPAYTGGLLDTAAAADSRWSDPFKSDKPKFSITKKNMAEHAATLTPGVQAMLERFPDLRIDVYPTHRSMRYPKWVLDNTVKNMGSAKLVGAVMGDGVEGAFGGIPFPQPKNGYEVMWNFTLAYEPAMVRIKRSTSYMVDTAGNLISLPEVESWMYRPYYDRKVTREDFYAKSMPYLDNWNYVLTPSTERGLKQMLQYSMNYSKSDLVSYLYMPDTRRSRRAPEYKYDTPISNFGGVAFWDEVSGFNGRMDRFDFKLVGKREVLVPYNTFAFHAAKPKDAYGPQHLNPDYVRWELHRVWVVEATLKEGQRHAYAKRTFFVDEDSWLVLEADGYDHSGKLWRVGFTYSLPFYGESGGMLRDPFGSYDLLKGGYFASMAGAPDGSVGPILVGDTVVDAEHFSPVDYFSA